jgi:hypothetical protein
MIFLYRILNIVDNNDTSCFGATIKIGSGPPLLGFIPRRSHAVRQNQAVEIVCKGDHLVAEVATKKKGRKSIISAIRLSFFYF